MKNILIASLVLILASCAVHVSPEPTGGSKADGIVELGFDIREMQRPIIDENEALRKALKRCQAWGYTKAEKFGGITSQCNAYGGMSGCMLSHITIKYQCVDLKSEISN